MTDKKEELPIEQDSPQELDWNELFPDKEVVQYEDIGGLEHVLDKLKFFQYGIQYPRLYAKFATKPPRGLLMHGPPGCGKTMIAKAMSHEVDCDFVEVPLSEIISKWVGQAEKTLAKWLKHYRVHYAKTGRKVMLFVDEAEQMFRKRGSYVGHGVIDRIVNQWLRTMDGIDADGAEGLIYVAATNHIDLIDPAVKRPGRFDYIVKIEPPGKAGALDIFQKQVRYREKKAGREIFMLWDEQDLIDKMYWEGITGADISAILREASEAHIRTLIENPGSVNDMSKFVHQDELYRAIEQYRKERMPKKKGRIGF